MRTCSKNGWVFSFAAAAWAACPVTAVSSELLTQADCNEEALSQLSRWQSTGEYLPSSNSTDNLVVLRSPTSNIGTWVVVTISGGRVDRLLRVSSNSRTEAEFDDQCRFELSTRSWNIPDRSQQWLIDEDVASIVYKNSHGVFYSWSPHMPLSVDGYKEIASAAANLDMSLTAVLSSHANVEYARDRGSRVDMPEEGYMQNQSVELTMRDFNVHAPALLIYSDGKFAGPVIPGFRRAADYEALIARFLSR
jgi:hypothetical protein